MRAPIAQKAPVDTVDLGDGRRVRLLDTLGKGGTSTTYRGLLESPSGVARLVALKLFAPVSSEEMADVCALARRTAVRGAAIRHPNIVELHEFGVWRTQPFFVTELVDGVSVQTLLDRYAGRGQRLPLDLALFIAAETAEALSGARTAKDHRGVQIGMLHLGLGPRKVLLGFRGEVKVTDFETAIAAAASSSIRSLRAVARRTATMAPEVARGGECDARSDVFSLGLLLRELFVGPRFARGIEDAEAVQLARDGFVEPFAFQPHLPEALAQVIARALEIEPSDRYPNATSLAFDLRRIALAMGASDGRIFLRRTLDREFGSDASEITAERPYATFGELERGRTANDHELHERRDGRERAERADRVDRESK